MKSRNAAKATTNHDRYIGERIREARIEQKLSMKTLASMLGISYQQLQKYESGKNRVNGARIELLVTVLNRPLNYFFPNATDVRAKSDPVLSALLASKEGQALVRDFARITSPRAKRVALDLVSLLAKENVDG